MNPEQLHRLRIQVKKARYSIEFFSGLFHGKECANRCKTIKSFLVKLQDSLGKLNDIVTHKTLFGDIIARPTKGLTGKQNHHRAFAAGPIIGDQQAKVQKSLDRARKAYSRFDRAKAFWKVTDPKQHVQAFRFKNPLNNSFTLQVVLETRAAAYYALALLDAATNATNVPFQQRNESHSQTQAIIGNN